jgi:chromate transporter
MHILLDLFITFFQIGLFTIGGGYAMIPLITEAVVSKGWTTEANLIDYIAVAESSPGPFALNTSTFIGMEQYGVLGAVVAALGLIMPSFIIILIIAKFFMKFVEYKGVAAALDGIRPAVIGLMISAVIMIAITAFNIKFDTGISDMNFLGIAVFAAVFGLSIIKKIKIDSYKIIFISAVLGIVFYSARDFAFTVILQ